MNRPARCSVVWIGLLAFACGGAGDDHDHDEHGSADSPAAEGSHGHAHTAPHGGTLLVLGDELAHAELLHDPETGELVLWLLDEEAEGPLRLDMSHVRVRIDGVAEPLMLMPRASVLTGETAGDTSEFGGRFPVLAGRTGFTGSILALAVRGRAFVDVEFRYPGDE